jgi:cytidylate kinase
MIRKLTRQERFLAWLIARLDMRLDRVNDREWMRHNDTAASRVIAYVEASRRN